MASPCSQWTIELLGVVLRSGAGWKASQLIVDCLVPWALGQKASYEVIHHAQKWMGFLNRLRGPRRLHGAGKLLLRCGVCSRPLAVHLWIATPVVGWTSIVLGLYSCSQKFVKCVPTVCRIHFLFLAMWYITLSFNEAESHGEGFQFVSFDHFWCRSSVD